MIITCIGIITCVYKNLLSFNISVCLTAFYSSHFSLAFVGEIRRYVNSNDGWWSVLYIENLVILSRPLVKNSISCCFQWKVQGLFIWQFVKYIAGFSQLLPPLFEYVRNWRIMVIWCWCCSLGVTNFYALNLSCTEDFEEVKLYTLTDDTSSFTEL